MWLYRYKLNYYEQIRRSLYETLRDALDRELTKIALIDSLEQHVKNGVEYNFVEKSELRPKSKKIETESKYNNSFLVIFSEGTINKSLKNYLRFFPENSVSKRNLSELREFTLFKRFQQNMRYFETPVFFNLLEELLKIDYAVLIQPDPSIKKRNHYSLTHYHVKVDWPIADAAEDLAKHLKYIQNNLYERGEKTGRDLQYKLFEYYGCHHNVSGRRTAGLIAFQLLKKLETITTVYVSSSESRVVYKYWERGISKYFLVKFDEQQIETISAANGLTPEKFTKLFLYIAKGFHYAIAEASYIHTDYALPPTEPTGKIRSFNPAYRWLKLREELILPKNEDLFQRPLPFSWIYA